MSEYYLLIDPETIIILLCMMFPKYKKELEKHFVFS